MEVSQKVESSSTCGGLDEPYIVVEDGVTVRMRLVAFRNVKIEFWLTFHGTPLS